MARIGTTLQSRIKLSPGSNALIAIMPKAGVPDTNLQRVFMVANALGAALKSSIEYAGVEPTGMTGAGVFVIGDARPVYISKIGPNPRLAEWNQKHGEPVGPDVYYYAVNVEWRVPPVDILTPAGIVVFPSGQSPATGAHNWPDGTLVIQQMRLAEERGQKRGVAQAKNLVDAANTATFIARSITESLAGVMQPLANVLLPIALGTVALVLLIKKR